MRRLLTWLAGIAGIAALLRRRSRQRAALTPNLPPSLPAPTVDPAIELRQKLDETRAAAPEAPAESEAKISLEERRRRVHERAKQAVDLMHGNVAETTGTETTAEDDAN